jgi:hypothetical protein
MYAQTPPGSISMERLMKNLAEFSRMHNFITSRPSLDKIDLHVIPST